MPQKAIRIRAVVVREADHFAADRPQPNIPRARQTGSGLDAANFDPAFERRIRTHVLFEMPGTEERERIWKLQIHPDKTPLAPDVDFRVLAEKFPVSGGDIKNAVLKAASAAAAEMGADSGKRIAQRHFEEGMQEVIAAKDTMRQSLFTSAIETARDPYQAVKPLRRDPAVIALGLAAAALLVALLALIVAVLR